MFNLCTKFEVPSFCSKDMESIPKTISILEAIFEVLGINRHQIWVVIKYDWCI